MNNKKNNAEALAYFTELQGERPLDPEQTSIEIWNRRAEAWEKERNDSRTDKDNDRVRSTVEYLKQRGLLMLDQDIADIGCGPGKFAAEFARTAHTVTGFDISDRMIHYGNERLHREGLTNVTLHVCDFHTLDIEKEKLTGKYDLVFSSLTPAIHGTEELKKFMGMSRGYCCNISHISHCNELDERIIREVFDMEPPVRWGGQSFYALFNILFLMGYNPEVTYHHRKYEGTCIMNEVEADLLMEHMLPPQERTLKNRDRIINWFDHHADSNGCMVEKRDTVYGRILWDVRFRRERPEYKTVKYKRNPIDKR